MYASVSPSRSSICMVTFVSSLPAQARMVAASRPEVSFFMYAHTFPSTRKIVPMRK